MASTKGITRREFVGKTGLGLVGLATGSEALQALHAREVMDAHLPRFDFDGPFVPRALVIGVGNAGGSIARRLSTESLPGLETAAIHTEARELEESTVDRTLLIGPPVTHGLGCIGRIDRGRRAVEDSRREVGALLSHARPDLVFLVGGLGGGTFTGGAPVIGSLTREAGALTVAVATRPFEFEGRIRNRQAAAGLAELAASADTTLVVPNEGVLAITGTDVRLVDAFELGVEVAAGAVRTITQMLTVPGIVNVGFADIRAVLQNRGIGAVGIGEASGEDRASLAAGRALASPFLRDLDPDRATGALFQIAGDRVGLHEFEEVSATVYDALDGDVVAIGNDTPDGSITGDVRVTVLAIGRPGQSLRASPPTVGSAYGSGARTREHLAASGDLPAA